MSTTARDFANQNRAQRIEDALCALLDKYRELAGAIHDGCSKAYLRDLCADARELEIAHNRAILG